MNDEEILFEKMDRIGELEDDLRNCRQKFAAAEARKREAIKKYQLEGDGYGACQILLQHDRAALEAAEERGREKESRIKNTCQQCWVDAMAPDVDGGSLRAVKVALCQEHYDAALEQAQAEERERCYRLVHQALWILGWDTTRERIEARDELLRTIREADDDNGRLQ